VSCDLPQTQAWALLQAARAVVDNFPAIPDSSASTSTLQSDTSCFGFHYKATTSTVETLTGKVCDADLVYSHRGGWRYSDRLPQGAKDMLDLYLPVLGTAAQTSVVIGHLGQSLDARIATTDGDAFFVTGEENRKHLHRLRSLCHAVVVGAGTVAADNPQLTTRAVSGASPVRIIIDPQARVADGSKVLIDGEAPTWLLHADTVCLDSLTDSGGCRRLVVRTVDGSLQPRDILTVLAEHGLRRIFVEGGGVTVSRFFNARCLDRLQIATAPVLVGEGVPALQIPGAPSMQLALRPEFRLYRMGEDVLWDFRINDALFSSSTAELPDSQEHLTDLQRIL
jgi:riboflavin-specific deaminase-like protein